jgi:hypothetical protein
MSRILYAHRLSKVLDEMVIDLGLTVVLSDQNAEVDLAKSIESIKMAIGGMDIEMKVQSNAGHTIVQFYKKG